MTAVALPSRPIGPDRVLVVDDRADVLDSLRLMLEEAGYQVFEAMDGPGAVEAVERVHPAAAIVDIGLPVFDGYEVAKRVRRLPDGQSMLLVALTGYGQPQARQWAEAAGFDLLLLKPVTPIRLREVLQSQPRN